MKKHITLTLIALLLSCALTACNTQTAIKTNEEKYGYVAFPGTDWGMSIEECTNALGLKEDDVEIKAEPAQPELYKFFETTIDYKGAERKAKFTFCTSYGENKKYNLGLISVRIAVDDFTDLKKLSDMADAFEIELKERNIPFSSGSKSETPTQHISYKSNMSINKLDDKNIATLLMEIINNGDKSSETANSMTEIGALSETSFSYYDKENPLYDGCSLYIFYSGFPAAVVNTAEKQLEAEKTN